MTRASAWSAPEFRRDRSAQQEPLDRAAQRRIMDLASQVLKESLELLGGAVGGWQELGRVEGAGLEALDVVELRHHLAPEPLDPSAYAYCVAALEPQPDAVGLPKDARRKRAGAVAELDRQV
jgi:hypothetical protein